MVTVALFDSTAATTVTISASMTFQNMTASRLLFRRNECDDEQIAFLRCDVERGPGRGTIGGRIESRVPRGAAVLHPRDPGAFIGPALEHHGLAAIEEVRLAAVGLLLRGMPVVHEPGAGDGDTAADRCLDHHVGAQVSHERAQSRFCQSCRRHLAY